MATALEKRDLTNENKDDTDGHTVAASIECLSDKIKDGNEDLLHNLSLSDPEEGRESCPHCLRPMSVCWCPHLPSPLITTTTKLVILQHPGEIKRNIRTCKMLELGLAPGCCTVYTGRKFPGKDTTLATILSDPTTMILYPGPDSVPLTSITPSSISTLVILDGTWDQARKLFSHNPILQAMPKVSISLPTPSEYIVRTQPSAGCMSTLEVGVHSIAILEDRQEIVQPMLAPLVAMCNMQINHGAVGHDTREFKLQNKEFKKRKPQYRRR